VNAFETEQLLGFATLRQIPSIVKNLHNTEWTEVAAANEISFARWPVAYRLLRIFRRKLQHQGKADLIYAILI
jgi:ABC-type arginine transport system ATPase subunit